MNTAAILMKKEANRLAAAAKAAERAGTRPVATVTPTSPTSTDDARKPSSTSPALGNYPRL